MHYSPEKIGFISNEDWYLQILDTTMGKKIAPNNANIYSWLNGTKST